MTEQETLAQLKQLLKLGYSAEDIQNISEAPTPLLNQALSEYQAEQHIEQQVAQIQHQQARFAMKLSP